VEFCRERISTSASVFVRNAIISRARAVAEAIKPGAGAGAARYAAAGADDLAAARPVQSQIASRGPVRPTAMPRAATSEVHTDVLIPDRDLCVKCHAPVTSQGTAGARFNARNAISTTMAIMASKGSARRNASRRIRVPLPIFSSSGIFAIAAGIPSGALVDYNPSLLRWETVMEYQRIRRRL